MYKGLNKADRSYCIGNQYFTLVTQTNSLYSNALKAQDSFLKTDLRLSPKGVSE